MPKTVPLPRPDGCAASVPSGSGAGPDGGQDAPETLDLPALVDVSQAEALRARAQAWLSARAAAGGGRVALADPDNVLSLQIAIATAKSGAALGLEIALTGADGPLPHEIRLTSDAGAPA
ncbi:hypothetical protein [Jannaschia seohaensis]|uniref:Uncharacterized protein n=1 Tax=Jannaschia seohaensis TaxID=475081 RepID=A0A2Y9B6L3_9RHOB|nr:hypothetical protein [Jannaschia seohaensis]PWJ09694.1 hypothetical protein BCF38_1311 [Jannaschia seohaensis]SSA52011.1 hypothetical protein SAMN05421539_1311 [Jannaschia seohaensis]